MIERKAPVGPVGAAEEALHALSFRALVIALVIGIIFSYLMAEWIRLGELILFSSRLTDTLPPVPCVAGLAFLLGVNPLLRKVSRRLALSRGQILVIYTFTLVSVAMFSSGVIRILFPSITTLQYFSGSTAGYKPLLKYLNPHFFPKDENVIQAFYEGADNEKVPWDAWAIPMIVWMSFFVVLFFTMLCLLTIFRKHWVEKERLSFPLAQFALAMTEGEDGKAKTGTFLRNPLMWLGFAMAALFSVTNILAAFDPSVPHMGSLWYIPLPESWGGWRLRIFLYPWVFGLAYLMPLHISRSIWVCYWLIILPWPSTLISRAMGLQEGRTDLFHDHYLAIGAYLALLLSLMWVARSHLAGVVRKAFRGDASVEDSQEAMPYRLAVFGFLGGGLFLVGFATVMGMEVLAAAALFFIALGFGLVYCKVRAEAGLGAYPPIWGIQDVLTYNIGSKHFSKPSLTVLSVFHFVLGGLTTNSAHQIDGMKMAPAGRVRQRQMGAVILLAILVGLAIACWIYLTTYYKYGGNLLETDDPTTGSYGVILAQGRFNGLVRQVESPSGPDKDKIVWTAVGVVFTTSLVVLRRLFFRFPLHPVGYATVVASPTMWGTFFFAWLAKFVALKVGGLRLYERLMPLAMGIVFGNFFTSAMWSFVGLIKPDWAHTGVF